MKRAPAGSVAAARILAENEVAEGLRLDAEDIAVLKACCSLRPPRNAGAIVSAIRTRLEYSQPRPKQTLEHTGEVEHRVSVTINGIVK